MNTFSDRESLISSFMGCLRRAIGRYYYDENPFIGSMANINMWSRTMEEDELAARTRYVAITLTTGKKSRVRL